MNNAINGFTHRLNGEPIPPRREYVALTPTKKSKRSKASSWNNDTALSKKQAEAKITDFRPDAHRFRIATKEESDRTNAIRGRAL